MGCHIWIRLNLPEKGFAELRESMPACDFYCGIEIATNEHALRQIAGVFTEEPIPEELTAKMPNLKWLHITRPNYGACRM